MASDKEKVALGSILASGGLTLAKAAVGLSTGSLAILSEAAHSLLDFAATVMTYFAVRISDKPADEEHHYGHAKIESVSALAETALLFLLSALVLWEAGQRLAGSEVGQVKATLAAFVVIAISVTVDFFRGRLLYRAAAETSSQALEADALHFSSDMWSSIAVLIGLGGVAAGYSWADSAAAIVVAVFICIAGWRLGRRTIDTLTDTAPAGVAPDVTAIAERTGGVVTVDRVRVRPAGAVLFIELSVRVSRTLPLDRVAGIEQGIRRALAAEYPTAEVTLVTEPVALDDETVLERIMVIARNRALAIHHVTVHTVAGRLLVSVDLEVDGRLSLQQAHDIADGFEAAVRDELGSAIEIDTHIEPLQTEDIAGEDSPPARIAAVAKELAEVARELGVVRDIHDVRVRQTEDGEIVNFHCRVDPSLSVEAVHEKVDEVEYALRRRLPEIKRIVGHAEPLRM